MPFPVSASVAGHQPLFGLRCRAYGHYFSRSNDDPHGPSCLANAVIDTRASLVLSLTIEL